MSNRWVVSGALIERDSLRFTPAGLPVATGKLRYAGEVIEAGVSRQLDFEISVVGIGEVAKRLYECALCNKLAIAGFVAPKSKRSRQWVLHIQTLTIEED